MLRRCVAVMLIALLGSSVVGQTARASSAPTRPATVISVFRLHVAGRVSPAMTFWVSYGPLGGRFGLIRLRHQSGNLYSGTRRLPTSGKTTFYYLMGHGTTRTRMGVVPGGPVTTIRAVGPASVWPRAPRIVRWQVPAG